MEYHNNPLECRKQKRSGIMSKWPDRPPICDGCYAATPNANATVCSVEPVWKGAQCPCITCLVKMTCDSEDDDCQLYFDYANQVPGVNWGKNE